MDPRIRSSLYEGAHGSPLYTAPRKYINPSTTGEHIQEEIAEVSKWVNQHLSSAGHTDQLVTDLTIDMADGITLLQLVQALSKEDLPKHFSNPIMRVQKLENLQMCVRALEQSGISMKGIHADDIAGGNVKTILAVCHALKRHFTTNNSPKGTTSKSPGSSVTTSPLPPPISSESGQLTFSSLDREDMALLGWLGDIVHRDISNYSLLYDGKILCDFANEIDSEAVSEQDIISAPSQERLQIAFSAIEKYLYVTPTGINIRRITTGKEDAKLRQYLTSCRSVYRQKMVRRQVGNGSEKGRGEKGHGEKGRDRGRRVSDRHSTASSGMSREEVFESLRRSSGSRTGSLEQRERVKIEARSREGIRQQRLSGSHGDSQTAERKQEKEKPTLSGETPPPNRLSSSISSLPSASKAAEATKPSSSHSVTSSMRGTLHGSHDHLSPSRQLTLPSSSSSRRPFSEIYVRGDPPISFSGHPASLGRSQSVEHSLGPPFPSQRNSAPSVSLSGTGGRKSSFDSGQSGGAMKSIPHSSSAGGFSYTLPRTKKQSSSSPPLSSPSSPTPPPLPTVPPPSSVTSVNQPTFVPPGGGVKTRKLPPYPVSEGDSLASQINDLQDRIALLSNQLLYEKADVYTRLHRAVIRERRRRQATEKRVRELENLAQQLVHHYDDCFVQLAKEVASLRQEVARGNGTSGAGLSSSGNRFNLTREVDQLKEQVTKLTGKLDIYSPHGSHSGSNAPPPESLFMRKRANSESNIHGPYMRGSASSFKKLSKFFGEEPPRVEDIKTFLEGLGYSHLYPTFSVHQISLAELFQMDAGHLEVLGIPLGARVRIMAELGKLEPLGKHTDS